MKLIPHWSAIDKYDSYCCIQYFVKLFDRHCIGQTEEGEEEEEEAIGWDDRPRPTV